jgi:hypothetical protein
MAVVPAVDREDFAALEAAFAEPFAGISSDGSPRPELFRELPAAGDATTAAVAGAATAFLATLEHADERRDAVRELGDPDRRRWTNAFATWIPQGVLLDDLDPAQRDAALRVIEASLSPEGYAEVRRVMALNRALGEYIQMHRRTLGEWIYWFTLFGDPAGGGPWGWQLMGHHIVLNCLLDGPRMVLAPCFLGAEIAAFESGPYAGLSALQTEQRAGLALVRALTPEQQAAAVLHRSMRTEDLPEALRGRVEGRHRAGAGRDNLVLPYAGVPAAELDADQRELLLDVVRTYVGRMAGPAAEATLALARAHLDATWFAWIGDPASDGPFYYRVHGPTLLLECDHHAGIFLDSDEPQPFHVHTILRAPNGGDYGMALLGA